MEQLAGMCEVQIRVGQKELRRAALDHGAQQIPAAEVVATLCRQQDGRVALPPGLQGFDEVLLDRGVTHEAPGFVQHKDFEPRRLARVLYDRTGAMEHVEQQRFENEWELLEPLEIEALQLLQR